MKREKINYVIIGMMLLMAQVVLTGCASKETMDMNYGEAYLIENERFSGHDDLSWNTKDESIAAFEDGNSHTGINAVVIAKAPGTTTIDVTEKEKKIASYTINVNIIPIEEVILSTNEIEVTEGETSKVQYTLLPVDASDYGLIWQSADESVATVEDGVITGKKVGQTTVILSGTEGISERCTVTVKEKSAYDRLSDREQAVVDMFLKHIVGFKDPSSIKINGVWDTSSSSLEEFVVNVSGTNGFGGATSETYMMTDDVFTGIGSWSSLVEWDDSFDIQLITEAIQEKIR